MSKFIVQETSRCLRTHCLKRLDFKKCIFCFDLKFENIDFTNMRVFVLMCVCVCVYFCAQKYSVFTIPILLVYDTDDWKTDMENRIRIFTYEDRTDTESLS